MSPVIREGQGRESSASPHETQSLFEGTPSTEGGTRHLNPKRALFKSPSLSHPMLGLGDEVGGIGP